RRRAPHRVATCELPSGCMNAAHWAEKSRPPGQAPGAPDALPRREGPAPRCADLTTITCAGHTTSVTSFCVDKRVADLSRTGSIPSFLTRWAAVPPSLAVADGRCCRSHALPLWPAGLGGLVWVQRRAAEPAFLCMLTLHSCRGVTTL